MNMNIKSGRWAFLLLILLSLLAACGGADDVETDVSELAPEPPPAVIEDPASEVTKSEVPFIIGGIPDQEEAALVALYTALADYLTDQLNVPVEYRLFSDKTAAISAFGAGEIDMIWVDGLSGVQARLQVPRSQAIVQRGRDEQVVSLFFASAESEIDPIADLVGLEGLAELAVVFGEADAIARVETGGADVGVIDAAVWEARITAGEIDASQFIDLFRTAPHADHHWVLSPAKMPVYGAQFPLRVTEAFTDLDSGNPDDALLLDLLAAERYTITDNDLYLPIEEIGRALGMIDD